MTYYARVGILYRGAGLIRSFNISHGEVVSLQQGTKSIGEQLDEEWSYLEHNESTLEYVEEWVNKESKGKLDIDRNYLDYFYRCLNENSEYYYLYEQGVGWACGNTTIETPIKSQLVRLRDAIPEMEQWMHDSSSI